jgi:Big-like domain-containing protein
MSGYFFGNAVSLTLTRFSSGGTTSAGDQFPQSLAYPNPYQGIAPVSGFYQGTVEGPSGSSPFLGMIDYKFNWVGFNKLSLYGGLRGDISYSVTSGTTYPYPWTALTYTISRGNTLTNPVANGSGSVLSFAQGFNLTGQFQSVSSPSSTVTVTAVNMYGPVGTTLSVTPPLPTVVGVGAMQQYKVELLYTDGTTTDVTTQCTFTTFDPSVATISPGGLATSVNPGFTQVIVNYSVYTGHAYIAVSSEGLPVLLDVRVMPPWPEVATAGTQSFIAIAHFSDGSSEDVTTLAVWSSGSTTVATVDPSTGVAKGVSAGTANITATYSGMSDTRPLQVTDPAQVIGMNLPSYREARPCVLLARIGEAAPGSDSLSLPPRRRQVPPLPHPA